jgi:hypothetical protein
MMLLSTALALNWVVGGHDSLRRMVGYAGTAFFGLMTAKFVRALLKGRAPVLSVSRYGIRDLRIANEFILWESVADVSACRVGRQSYVVLKLTPAVERRLFCVDTVHDADGKPGAGHRWGRHQPGRPCRGFRQPAEDLFSLFCCG